MNRYLISCRLLIISFALLMVGCNDDLIKPDTSGNGNTVLPGGFVEYSLYSSYLDFEKPLNRTGAADENNATGDMWMFVFDATKADPIFLEAVKASDHEAVNGGASKRTAILKTRAHQVTIFILDNTPATYFNGTASVAITDAGSWGLTPDVTTLSQARAQLNTILLGTPSVNTVPYTPSLKIPLSIEINRGKLDASTQFGNTTTPLGLQRVVARLTVKKDFISEANNANTPPFVLKGATVYNAPRNASLFPIHKNNSSNLTNYIGSTQDNEITGIAAAVNDDTAVNPIYLYPSAESAVDKQPFVLIQARFNNDSEDTYYKLAVAPIGRPVGRIERNATYSLLIKGCTGRGYATINEAINSPASNLIYKVDVTDLSSHDMIDNGQYYIGLSNSEYHFYVYNSFINLDAATLYTGNNSGAEAFAGNVSITSNDPTNLIVQTPIVSHPVTNHSIKINVTKDFTEGMLTIHLGNLVKEIKVKRMSNSFIEIKNELIVNDYYKDSQYKVASVANPSSWIKLGTASNTTLASGQDVVASSVGGVYICYNASLAPPDLENSVYISRGTNEGRIKAHFFLSPTVNRNISAPQFVIR